MARIDITRPVADICDALGIEPTRIRMLHITPGKLKAEVYDVDENGSKYVNRESGHVAVEAHEWNVTT